MHRKDIINCANCSQRCTSIFNELNMEQIALLNSSKDTISYKKGDTVFHEGSYPRGLFCINSGKIKAVQKGADGKEQILHFAKASNVLGYRALLSDDKYSCSAVAIEDCTLCFVPKDVFLMLAETNSKVSQHIIHLLSHDIREAETKITAIAQRPVKERVAQGLLLLIETYGFEGDGHTINVHITRGEIANIAGTTRESVIRVLFDFKTEKIIELTGKSIQIVNYKELIKEANI